MYKLSPSDFGYLWEECKYCYYQKVKYGISHSGAFPSMFGRINSLLQNSVMGKNLNEIAPNMPSGIIESQEGYVKSKPVIGAEDCFISGRYDILAKLEDGTYCVIDFKITPPDDEKMKSKYASQLHAYKYAFENPINGNTPIKISKFGLVSINPEETILSNGKVVFSSQPTWHPVEINMDGFYKLVKEVSNLLNGELPVPSPSCSLCKYRVFFNKETVIKNDLPF